MQYSPSQSVSRLRHHREYPGIPLYFVINLYSVLRPIAGLSRKPGGWYLTEFEGFYGHLISISGPYLKQDCVQLRIIIDGC